MWLKIKPQIRRCWSMISLTRDPFGHKVVDPEPYVAQNEKEQGLPQVLVFSSSCQGAKVPRCHVGTYVEP